MSRIDLQACYQCLLGVIEVVPQIGICPVCAMRGLAEECWNQICRDPDRQFGRVYAIGYRYGKNLLHILINNLKFYGRNANTIPLATLLWGYMRDNSAVISGYDLIAPIPRTAASAAQRGDQLGGVVRLAKHFLGSTGHQGLSNRIVTSESQVLVKVLETGRSVETPHSEKKRFWRAVQAGEVPCPYAASAEHASVEGKDILLVDDVFTSGYHSAQLAAFALRTAGATNVDVLAIGRHLTQ
jgi:predicted amidophosphoribosyltransferase